MSVDPKARSAPDDLQFDRAVHTGDAAGGAEGLTCGRCNAPIATQYYHADGQVLCPACKQIVEREQQELTAKAKSGAGFTAAAVFGLGAAIAGAIIYYAVARITNLEIGIVAILIGFMVGGAIRKGASGAGGRRFQLLAAGLTYLAVGLAYAPFAFEGLSEAASTAQDSTAADSVASLVGGADSIRVVSSGTTSAGDTSAVAAAATDPLSLRADSVTGTAASPTDEPVTAGGFALALGGLALLVFALPVLTIVGSLPGGLINALIIGFGMHQAWRMTGAHRREITGPYTVKAPGASTGA